MKVPKKQNGETEIEKNKERKERDNERDEE